MDIEALKKQLIRHEGLKLKPYRCTAGKLTIGVGRNLDDRGVSNSEAMYMLDNDIELAINELTSKEPVFGTLDEVRQRVLVDMHFNLGYARLKGFKNFWAAIARRDWKTAAFEMLNNKTAAGVVTPSKWAIDVGPRALRLAVMMETGRDAGRD